MNDQLGDRLPVDPSSGHGRSGGHSWMMIACCVPMIAIAVILVATGVVGISLLLVTLMCVAMMALMMRVMDHGDGGGH